MHACTQGEGRKRSRHGVQEQLWEPWADRQALLEHFTEMQGLNTIKQYRLRGTVCVNLQTKRLLVRSADSRQILGICRA